MSNRNPKTPAQMARRILKFFAVLQMPQRDRECLDFIESEVDAVCRERDAARSAAEHFAHCRTCGEESIFSCQEGQAHAHSLGIVTA